VVHNDPVAPQDDEVILCVPTGKLLVRIICIMLIGLVALFCDLSYRVLSRGDYLDALIGGFACLGLLAAAVNGLVAKHILFYRDRVEEVRYPVLIPKEDHPLHESKARYFSSLVQELNVILSRQR
jgi:hypothetical protein